MQTADCRPDTKCRLGTKCRLQTADCKPDTKCRLGTKCRLQTAEWVQNTDWESKEFFRLVIACHLTTYRASRNRFSVIILHDYLHYCGIFLVHFLIKIDLNIISSPHVVFSLCVRVGWYDVCTYFTNVIKLDVDVNEMSLSLNIWHAQHSRNNWQLCTWSYYHLFKRYLFILLTKMQTETKTVPSTWYIFRR